MNCNHLLYQPLHSPILQKNKRRHRDVKGQTRDTAGPGFQPTPELTLAMPSPHSRHSTYSAGPSPLSGARSQSLPTCAHLMRRWGTTACSRFPPLPTRCASPVLDTGAPARTLSQALRSAGVRRSGECSNTAMEPQHRAPDRLRVSCNLAAVSLGRGVPAPRAEWRRHRGRKGGAPGLKHILQWDRLVRHSRDPLPGPLLQAGVDGMTQKCSIHSRFMGRDGGPTHSNPHTPSQVRLQKPSMV